MHALIKATLTLELMRNSFTITISFFLKLGKGKGSADQFTFLAFVPSI